MATATVYVGLVGWVRVGRLHSTGREELETPRKENVQPQRVGLWFSFLVFESFLSRFREGTKGWVFFGFSFFFYRSTWTERVSSLSTYGSGDSYFRIGGDGATSRGVPPYD